MISCVDIMEEILKAYIHDAEFLTEPSQLHDIDFKKFDILKTYCKAIDELSTIEEVNVTGVSAEIDPATGKAIIGIECTSLEAYPECSRLKELMSRAEKMDIKLSEVDDAEIVFTFPSLWVK